MRLLLLNPKRKLTVKKGEAMHKRRKHARKTVARRHIKRRNPRAVATVASAPVHHKRRSIKRRVSTGVSVATRRLKRRVRGFGGSSRSMVPAAKQVAIQGAIAGFGAIGADIVAAQIMKYVPASLKTAQMQPFAQVAVSVLAGLLISKVNKRAGDAVAVGGVTVATYNLGKALLKTAGVTGLSNYSNLQGYDYDPSYGLGSPYGMRSVSTGNALSEYTGDFTGDMFGQNTFANTGMGMYDQDFGVNY